MKIEVKRADASVRSGTSDNGKPWSMKEQAAYAYTVDKDGKPDEYPTKIVVRLDASVEPYKPGFYELDDRSFFAAQWGKLQLGSLVLRPAPKT